MKPTGRGSLRLAVRHLFQLSIGLLLFGLLIWYGGTSELAGLLEADPFYITVAFLVTLVITIVSAARWKVLVDELGSEKACTLRECYHYLILSRATSLILPPTISDFGVRTISLRLAHDFSAPMGLYSVLLDRLFDLLNLLLVGLPATLFFSRLWPTSWSYALVILMLSGFWAIFEMRHKEIVTHLIRGYLWLLRTLSRLPIVGSRWGAGWRGDSGVDRPFVGMETRKLYRYTLIKSLLAALRIYLLALAFHLRIPFAWMFFGMAVVQLGVILSITPGGLGFVEMGWYAILTLAGLETPLVVAFLVGRRVLTALFLVVLALASQVTMRLKPEPAVR